MLLSHKHKFIFIHIPKTGGTSIKRALLPYSDVENRDESKHKTSVFWKKQLGKKTWKSYFKFVFVRNPWDRMVSRRYYQMFVNGDEKARDRGLAFKDFEEFLGSDRSRLVINQSRYFHNKFGKNMVDFVGRFENFQEQFDQVCDKIGIDKIELSHLNSSPRGEYRQYYNDKTKKIVEKACKDDIMRYGYKF
jgi:hypothetical protein